MEMIVSHDPSLKIEKPELYQLYWNFEKLEVQTFISSTIFFPEISCNFRIHFLYSVEQLTRARVRYHAEKKKIYIYMYRHDLLRKVRDFTSIQI